MTTTRFAGHALAAMALLAGAAAAAPPRLDSALATQQRLAEQHPDDPAVHNDLGNLLHLAERPEEAKAAYERALSLDSEHRSALFNLSLLQQEIGRRRQARRNLHRLLDLEPGNAWAHYHLGTVLAGAGRRNRAIRHFAEAFRLDPRLTEPRVNPHIVVNSEAAVSILVAFGDQTAAETTPRVYDRPSRVTRLLIPEPGPPAEPAAESPTTAAPPADTPETTETPETPPGGGG